MKEIIKFFNKIKNWFIGTTDVNKDGQLNKEDIKSLKNKTKSELEKIGRKIGVELDKRFTKSKLISQIKKIKKIVKDLIKKIKSKLK